jgi:hypothetical protein
MGAAIGLQTTAVSPSLCAVAVESPYSTFREISYERLGRGTHTGTFFWRTVGWPVIEVAIVYTRLRYESTCPMLTQKLQSSIQPSPAFSSQELRTRIFPCITLRNSKASVPPIARSGSFQEPIMAPPLPSHMSNLNDGFWIGSKHTVNLGRDSLVP